MQLSHQYIMQWFFIYRAIKYFIYIALALNSRNIIKIEDDSAILAHITIINIHMMPINTNKRQKFLEKLLTILEVTNYTESILQHYHFMGRRRKLYRCAWQTLILNINTTTILQNIQLHIIHQTAQQLWIQTGSTWCQQDKIVKSNFY